MSQIMNKTCASFDSFQDGDSIRIGSTPSENMGGDFEEKALGNWT